ncbi:transcription elongation factor spt4 [Pleosporales sp. CAS-2024a]
MARKGTATLKRPRHEPGTGPRQEPWAQVLVADSPSMAPPEHPPRPSGHTMTQHGAYIPPNQQRNMRACMVCSIVRTQQQFTTQGCPNCEDILELAGNPEQVNDCTSQVFEGLISVADTNRSWVARYQRLEGYVPGVYATQVEGILPEDVLVAVENAGINYVPRDGSEQEMLAKD